MGFFAGALAGSKEMLGRRLAERYRAERDAVADSQWERTHALNRGALASRLRGEEQMYKLNEALFPGRVTAQNLANQGARQQIEQSDEIFPYQKEGIILTNQAAQQGYRHREGIYPIQKEGATLANLLSQQMIDYRKQMLPFQVEGANLANTLTRFNLEHTQRMSPEQFKAAQIANRRNLQAYQHSAAQHPWNMAMMASQYNLGQLQIQQLQDSIHQSKELHPWQKQYLQAQINAMNAALTGQTQGKSPTFRPQYAELAERAGMGFVNAIAHLKEKKGWFSSDAASPYQVLEEARHQGETLRANLGNAFTFTPDDIHRYASSFMAGLTHPDTVEQYNAMTWEAGGRKWAGKSDFEKRLFNAFWQGIAGIPKPGLTPEQQAQIGEGVTDDGWFNLPNMGWAAAGGLTTAEILSRIFPRKLGWMRPSRVVGNVLKGKKGSVGAGTRFAGKQHAAGYPFVGHLDTPAKLAKHINDTIHHYKAVDPDDLQRLKDMVTWSKTNRLPVEGISNPRTWYRDSRMQIPPEVLETIKVAEGLL